MESIDTCFTTINNFIKTIDDDFANARCSKMLSILSSLPLNFSSLSSFIPFDVLSLHPSLRSLCWKAFSNYYPSSNISSFHSFFTTKRNLYTIMKSSYTSTPPPPSASLIHKDLQRTRNNMNFLTQHPPNNGSETHFDVLQRILNLFAYMNKDIGYHQGMNEIAFIFYYCFLLDEDEFFKFHAEEDAFWCFNNYIISLRNVYTCKEGKNELGVMDKLNNVQHMLKILDPELYKHLDKEKVVLSAIMIRWYFVGLIQCFSCDKAMIIFDNILSEKGDRYLYLEALCLSILKVKRKTLLMCVNDFDMKIYHELHHLKEEDVGEILQHVKKIIMKINSIRSKENSAFIFC